MSLALPLALLLALGIGFVVLAHALRRGAAQLHVFPGAHLLEHKSVTAKKRSRLEDRALMALRSLMVLALALLAASPSVSCSRFSLARSDGASVAAILILDDSGSMAARIDDGTTRFDRARETARRLLEDMQPGDTTAIVLMGHPARVLVAPTHDARGSVDALQSTAVTERGTDLPRALELSRSLLSETPQSDQRIVLLSDLSTPAIDDVALDGVVIPEISLTEALVNCAVVRATHQGQAVAVELACTDEAALRERAVRLLDDEGQTVGTPRAADSTVLVLPTGDSTQAGGKRATRVQLSRSEADQIPQDDEGIILQAQAELLIGVRADSAKAGLKTGTATVLQSGLESLQRGVFVSPLSLLPDDEAEFEALAALLIDDPSGLPPEMRSALEEWVQRGGVAAAFLGPAVERAPLGSNFAPFSPNPPRWVRHDSTGARADAPGALGPLTTTWADLGAEHRVEFVPTEGMQVLATWTDGAPLVTSQRMGQGLVMTTTLPASVDESDFALRPAYLELLDTLVTEAALRRGATAVDVGSPIVVTANAQVWGPDGEPTPVLIEEDSALSLARAHFSPDRAGSYRIEEGEGSDRAVSLRYALRLPDEHIAQPRDAEVGAGALGSSRTTAEVSIARHVALALLILCFLELALRLLGPPVRPWSVARRGFRGAGSS